ncbi:hypothetical protein C5167_011012 [Papaver somniferum]|uniref:Uncharacterized protein n=1 Tax=Papaver somniferum TaxID=3469 RepID=A0A4Y7K5T4_PAPSO|nr:hypothetical protein C5167_011012 [Papaver somniferum]
METTPSRSAETHTNSSLLTDPSLFFSRDYFESIYCSYVAQRSGAKDHTVKFFDFSKTVAKRAYRVIQVHTSVFILYSKYSTLLVGLIIEFLCRYLVFGAGYSQCEIFIFSSIRGISFSSYCLMQLIVVPENRLHLYFKKRQVGDDDKAEEQPFNLTLMIMKQDAEYMWESCLLGCWFRLEDLLIKCGMLNLVDLAGFENISRSGAGEELEKEHSVEGVQAA